MISGLILLLTRSGSTEQRVSLRDVPLPFPFYLFIYLLYVCIWIFTQSFHVFKVRSAIVVWKRKRQRTSYASGKETTQQKVFTLDNALPGYPVLAYLGDRLSCKRAI